MTILSMQEKDLKSINFMIKTKLKTLSKLGIEGTFLNKIKASKNKKAEYFSPRSRTKQSCLITPIHHRTGSSSQWKQKERN